MTFHKCASTQPKACGSEGWDKEGGPTKRAGLQRGRANRMLSHVHESCHKEGGPI